MPELFHLMFSVIHKLVRREEIESEDNGPSDPALSFVVTGIIAAGVTTLIFALRL